MKLHRTASFLTTLSLTASLWGAGYEFEGVGARQVSRAGAAIADSNDWTSLYWNPASIPVASQATGSEFGFELFGGEAYGKDSNSMSSLPGVGAAFAKDDLHSNFILGALGLIMPIGSKGGWGVGFYTPLLQGANFEDSMTASPTSRVILENSATILTATLSGGYQFTPKFSGGAGLNLLYGRLISDVTLTNFPFATNTLHSEADGDGTDLEAIFGLRYDATPKFSVGANYRSGSDVELEGDATAVHSSGLIPNESSSFSYELRHPPTWGIGTAFRPSPNFTWTVDFNRTLWHRFISNVVYDNPGSSQPNLPNAFHWKDSYKIRTGIEWKASERVIYLAGYSFDHQAIDGQSIDFATSLDVPMHRVAVGATRIWKESFETTLGVIGGSGSRNEGGVDYRLSGYQVMLETRFLFSRPRASS